MNYEELKQKASKGPFKEFYSESGNYFQVNSRSKRNDDLCDCCPSMCDIHEPTYAREYTSEMMEANAQLIAHCLNTYDELLEALEGLRGCIMETRGKDAHLALIAADEALKNAKEVK